MFPPPITLFSTPSNIRIDDLQYCPESIPGCDGNYWYIKESIKVLGRITPDGTATEFALPTGFFGHCCSGETYFTVGNDGKLYIADRNTNGAGGYGSGQILIVDISNVDSVGPIYAVKTPAIAYPESIMTSSDGNVWYTSYGTAFIRYDPVSDLSTVFSPPVPHNFIADIVEHSDGSIWGSNYFGGSYYLRRLDRNSPLYFDTDYTNDMIAIPLDPINTRAIALASCPDTIAGCDGNLWMGFPNRITRVDGGDYSFTDYAVSGWVNDIVAGSDGALWLAIGSSIGKIEGVDQLSDTSTDIVQYYSVGASPYTLIEGGNNDIWFSTTSTTNQVGRMSKEVPSRITNITHSFSSGALKVPVVGDSTITQNLALDIGKTFKLEAFAYLDGSTPVDEAVAQLMVHTSPISTTYQDIGGGWYRLTGYTIGTGGSFDYGVLARAGTVYIDSLSLRQVSGSFHASSPFFSSSGVSRIDVPPTATVDFTTTRPLIPGNYTFSIYAYTDGSPMTTADAELVFNGSTIP
ncbi:MAG: hypothetical protein ACOCXQ_01795, partial [Patescibacteria group bacterium]